MLIRNFFCYFTKDKFHHRDFPAILKSLLTLKRSICSDDGFQYSCQWYAKQIELLKMLNFPRLSNTAREVYEDLCLEACRF